MKNDIRAAGKYLLSVLKTEKVAPYGRFYSFKPGADTELAEGVFCFHEGTGEDRDELMEDLTEQAHLYLEWAAHQLQDFGAIKIVPLPGVMLPDGEEDFEFRLTKAGERLAATGKGFNYRHLESRFFGGEASEWLIEVPRNNDPTEVMDWQSVADVGDNAEIKVKDDQSNTYPIGSPVYNWAFQVALWNHVRERNIDPVFTKPEHEVAWKKIGDRPHLFHYRDWPAELDGLNYRLTSKAAAHPNKLRHLGWFGGEG